MHIFFLILGCLTNTKKTHIDTHTQTHKSTMYIAAAAVVPFFQVKAFYCFWFILFTLNIEKMCLPLIVVHLVSATQPVIRRTYSYFFYSVLTVFISVFMFVFVRAVMFFFVFVLFFSRIVSLFLRFLYETGFFSRQSYDVSARQTNVKSPVKRLFFCCIVCATGKESFMHLIWEYVYFVLFGVEDMLCTCIICYSNIYWKWIGLSLL